MATSHIRMKQKENKGKRTVLINKVFFYLKVKKYFLNFFAQLVKLKIKVGKVFDFYVSKIMHL